MGEAENISESGVAVTSRCRGVLVLVPVSEALFCLCRGTNIYNSFGV